MKRASSRIGKKAYAGKSGGAKAAKRFTTTAQQRTAAARKSGARLTPAPVGFQVHARTGLVLPAAGAPVPAGKIQQGIAEAKRQLDATLHGLIETLTGTYEIKEIKLVASFNAEGKFLGFGLGGAASMEITVCPCSD